MRWSTTIGTLLLSTALGCGPARAGAADRPSSRDEDESAAPQRDPQKDREDAVLLGTLLAGTAGYSLGSAFGGLASCASGVTFGAASTIYLARGGSAAPAIGPMTFGVGALGAGIYRLASAENLGSLQLEFYRAAEAQTPPGRLVDVFEPKFRRAAERARVQRRLFGAGLIGLSVVTLGAAIFATVRPVPYLEGGTLPSVLYGAATIDLLAAITTLTYESPTERAWLAYVRGTTLN